MEFKQQNSKDHISQNIRRQNILIKSLIILSTILFFGNIIRLLVFYINLNKVPIESKPTIKTNISKKAVFPDIIKTIQNTSPTSKIDQQKSDLYGTTMQFTSNTLGLKFNYLTHWWQKTDSIEDKPIDIFVSRSTNKVCVARTISDSSDECINGQYVLLFKKDAKISYQKFIELSILNNNKDCVVTIYSIRGDKEIAEITSLNDNCPEIYSKKGVNKYFQYDNKFSDRVLFISLDQQPIWADTSKNTWETTLELF